MSRVKRRLAKEGTRDQLSAISSILCMAIANEQVGAFSDIEMASQAGDVQIAQIDGLLSGDHLAARKIIDAAGGVEMDLRIAGIEREPVFGQP